MRTIATFFMMLFTLPFISSPSQGSQALENTPMSNAPDSSADDLIFASLAADDDEALANVSIDSILIDDKAEGNGNGIIEPGEIVNITVVARNGSFGQLTGLRGNVQIANGSGIRLRTNTLTYDTIPRNSSAANKDPVVLVVDKNTECGTRFSASYTLNGGGSSVSISKPYQLCK